MRKRVASVPLSPEECSPSVPLHSFSCRHCWRGPLGCMLRLLGQAVLGRFLTRIPGAALSAAWGKRTTLGLLVPGDKFCALWWQRWAFGLRSGIFHLVHNIPVWIHLASMLWKEHTGKFSTLHRDM